MLTDLLPAGFYVVGSERAYEFERASQRWDAAWSVYTIDGDAAEAIVHWRTNDDHDTGAPSAYADDTWVVRPGTLEGGAIGKALRHTYGGTRFGVGQVVLVYVNGALVEGPRL